MLNFLLRRRSAPPRAEFTAPIRSETRVYAVGDIHGRADLLASLLERIDAEIAEHDGPAEVVFLGDYVDRGLDSKGVLDLLIGRAQQDPRPVLLMGNHEQMLLDFVREPKRGRRWLRFGGLETLMSYGVGGIRGLGEGTDLSPVRDALVEAMGPHLDFLERLTLTHRNGNVLFVHAAADPEVAPESQEPETLLWGCEAFESQPREDGVWVVHGHTVVSAPEMNAGRVAIDTGAYFSGCLSAVRIDGERIDFLTS